MKKLLSITFVILLLSACNSLNKTTETKKLENTNWVLISIGNEKPSIENPITLVFQQENKFSGKGVCNRYFGEYIQNEKQLKFQKVGSTKMACPNLSVESNYFNLLNLVESFEIKNKQLLLKSKETTLIFESSGDTEIQQ